MVKKVVLIGIGVSEKTLTSQALDAIENAEMFFGAPRMLEPAAIKGKPALPIYEAEKIRECVETEDKKNFVVFLSGDTGFYSGANALVKALYPFEVEVLPGVSSLSYFFSRLKRPWQHAALISAHGKEVSIVDAVRRNKETFVLTGRNTNELATRLCEAGFEDLMVTLGENLGGIQEKITAMPVKDLKNYSASSLCVLLIDNPLPDKRVRAGIDDAEFIRGNAPMTKAPVRAQILSQLHISPDDICYDVGAGTGSVSVEMALSAYEGRVYAIEQKEDAFDLIEKNIRSFHLGNVTCIKGSAPHALKDLPAPDCVFIGGCSGKMDDTFSLLLQKNRNVRIVLTTIALESLSEALDAFKRHGLSAEILQLASSRAKEAGNMHLMIADNPIYILSAGGKDE